MRDVVCEFACAIAMRSVYIYYLCVKSPPGPVSQEQILPDVALDNSNSNSTRKLVKNMSYFFKTDTFQAMLSRDGNRK